jgi:O-glycosyl hydrolase
MTYEVQVETRHTDRRKVEAESVEEAMNLARDGEGESTNEAQTEVRVCAQPWSPPSSMLATGIRQSITE